MKYLEVTSNSPQETQRYGQRLGELAEPGDIYLLVGNLGSGKTCLTQGIALGLDIQDYILSPTFVLIRELQGRLPLYHIDLYRMESMEEVMELGLENYLNGQGVSVVEWAEKGLSIFPEENLLIEIDYLDDTARKLRFKPRGQRYLELVKEFKNGLI